MKIIPNSLGPVMLDLTGLSIAADELEMLRHPLVGGVILFSRNYASPEQLNALCAEIHSLREPGLLIAADHEGGRVQRFRQGFTAIPAMNALGRLWDSDRGAALRTAESIGYVLAAELRACGVDLSFAPVLDLDYGASTVIGDRAFHADPRAVVALARPLIAGFRRAGMSAVGKHFPGHGFIGADSHVAVPVDNRPYHEIMAVDAAPYKALGGSLGGVMPAHVIYDSCDPHPAGFSAFWLREILRGQLGFEGVIFSDDLSMEGASVAGGIEARAAAALTAGCDMVLVCNAPQSVAALLEHWHPRIDRHGSDRVTRLRCGQPGLSRRDLAMDQAYLSAREAVATMSAAAADRTGCDT